MVLSAKLEMRSVRALGLGCALLLVGLVSACGNDEKEEGDVGAGGGGAGGASSGGNPGEGGAGGAMEPDSDDPSGSGGKAPIVAEPCGAARRHLDECGQTEGVETLDRNCSNQSPVSVCIATCLLEQPCDMLEDYFGEELHLECFAPCRTPNG